MISDWGESKSLEAISRAGLVVGGGSFFFVFPAAAFWCSGDAGCCCGRALVPERCEFSRRVISNQIW
jgi:hypothetical protein